MLHRNWLALSAFLFSVGVCFGICPSSLNGQTSVTVSSYEILNCAVQAQVPFIYVNRSIGFPQDIVVPPRSSIQISSSPGFYPILQVSSQNRLFNISGQSQIWFKSLTLIGGKTIGTATDGSIGGILYMSSSRVNIFNSTLMDGLAICGSAIYATNQAILTIDSSKVVNNTDNLLGECYGAIVVEQSNITISQSIVQNNDGYGAGGIYMSKTHATVLRSAFIGNTALSTDGGAIIATSSTLTIEDSTFVANTASRNGGGIFVENDVNVTIHGTSFQNNAAVEKGGSIASTNSRIFSSMVTITGSTSAGGGSVYLSGGLLQVFNNSLNHNTASVGGGIFCSDAILTIQSSLVTDNIATSSGGGIAAQDQCTVNITQSPMLRNFARKSTAPIAIGGAISCQDSFLSVDSTVIANGAAVQGAAIFSSNCEVVTWDMDFHNLQADNSAIYTSESKFSMTRSRIYNCTAAVSTSAITCFDDTHCTITDSSFYDNVAQDLAAIQIFNSVGYLYNSTFANNSVRGSGGAVYIFQSQTVKIHNCTFIQNQAGNSGGAVSISLRSNVDITSSEFIRNSAASGGAVEIFDECMVTMENITFFQNKAEESGGSVYLNDNSVLIGDEISVEHCVGPYGGGFYVGYESSLDLNGLIAKGNVATYAGGVIAAFDTATVCVNNSDFTNNQASLGGVITGQYKSSITLNSCEIYQNKVDAYGGVMYLLVGSIAEVYYCSFYENDGRYGGGVGYIETSSIVVESSSFLDQSANAGAVFFMVHSQAIIDGSSFTSNGIKAFNGGAIYLSSQSLLTSRSNVFSSNEAVYGGAIALVQSRLFSISDTFYDCIAKAGGCIYSTINSTVHTIGDQFTKNRASVASSGVIYATTGSLVMKNSIFSQNSVRIQGCISLFSVDTSIINSYFTKSTVVGTNAADGGVLYIGCSSPCVTDATLSTTITNSTFIDNSALNGIGGAVYANSYPGSITVMDSIFSSNRALNGGGMGVKYSLCTIENSMFNNNTANEGGGAIFWFYDSTKPTKVINITNSGNRASYGDLHATDLVSLNSSFPIYLKQVSGSQLTAPVNVTLLDYYGQIVRNSSLYDGASTTIYCSVDDNSGVIKGKSIVPSELGIATFSELTITGIPNGNTTLRFSVPISVIPDHFQRVDFRPCIAGEITVGIGQGLSSCQECGYGTYSFNPSDTECIQCPLHAKCPGGNVLDLDKNFWRVDDTSATILECPVPDVCLGGPNVTTQCATGQTGPYCTVCEEGYTKSSSGYCYSCNDSVGTLSEILSTLLFVICGGIVYLLYRYRKNIINWYSKKMNTTVRNRRLKSVNIKTKIVISFCQIIFQLGPAFNIVFPSAFLRYLNYYSIFQLNLLVLPNVGCVVSANYYDALVATTLSPPIIFIFIAFLIQLKVLRAKRLNEKNPAYTERKALKDTITLSFLISYFVLVNVSTKIFEVFQCETFDDGSSYLVADYSINCNDPIRPLYLTYGVIMIFIYPVGIPLIYGIILFRNRHMINPESSKVIDAEEKEIVSQKVVQKEKMKVRSTYEEIRNIKNLFESYIPKRWYFELIDCARRLCLGAIPVLIFRGSTLQIVIVLLVSLFSVCAFMYLQPYIHSQDNHLAIIAQWSITLIVISAMIIKVQAVDNTNQNTNSLGAILILLNVCVIAFSFCAALLDSKVTDDEDPAGLFTDLNGDGDDDDEEEEDNHVEDVEEGDHNKEEQEDSAEKRKQLGWGKMKKRRIDSVDLLSSDEEDDQSIDSDDEPEEEPSSTTPSSSSDLRKRKPHRLSESTGVSVTSEGNNHRGETTADDKSTKRFAFGSKRTVNNAQKPLYEVEMNPMTRALTNIEGTGEKMSGTKVRSPFKASERMNDVADSDDED